MINQKIEEALNEQILIESQASLNYLGIAGWAERQRGFSGVSAFFYAQSGEESSHMLKLIHYLNEAGAVAKIAATQEPLQSFSSLQEVLDLFLSHEQQVTASIRSLLELSLQEKDYTTFNFLQWYVTEQLEEEKSARLLLDQYALLGEEKTGLFLFDREVAKLAKKDD